MRHQWQQEAPDVPKLKDTVCTRTQEGCLAVNILGWNINTLNEKVIILKMEPEEFVKGII